MYMAIKIFILGRPGSGESTVAQLLEATVRENGCYPWHLYDYKYLHDMFQQEIDDNLPEKERSFLQKGPEACQGFDVCNFKVLNTVLKKMAEGVRTEERNHLGENTLLLIEFARKEYGPALELFGHDILRHAYLLYVNLDLGPCIQRIHWRAVEKSSRSEYDHFVSDDIMKDYYSGDDWSDGRFSAYIDYLHSDGVDVKFEELDNSGTDKKLKSRVGEFFHEITRVATELVATH
jgi:hypothetical protein